ncbi:MAG: 4-hydroxy-tetrahydrodipicolinate reductase [Phycisphaerales bacterium]
MSHANHPHLSPSTSPASAASSRTRIVLHGALGRMGQRIAACVPNEPHCHIVQALDRDDELQVSPGAADLVIDFSSDEGALRALQLAQTLQTALLVGTTGLSAATRDAIVRAGDRLPVMLAPNTSLGVAVARRLVQEAARLLPGFDIDIVETHHTRKLDAPSGTARSLAEAVQRGTDAPLPPERIHAIRAGDVVGDHVVTFNGPGERLEIGHFASSRDLFALGALRIGQWLARQKPGVHTTDEWFEHYARPHR